MRIISEVFEDIQVLTESTKSGEKKYFVEGVFLQAEVKNRNGRIYPVNILHEEVDRYTNEYISKNRAFGELGHPENPQINLERVSHMITSLQKEGNNYIGRASIMDTPYGKIVKNFIDAGAKLGVSSRGLGSLNSRNGVNYVNDDFRLMTAADIVADPSAPDAFVNSVMESQEWIYEAGQLISVDIETYKKKISEATRREREKVMIESFSDFMSKLRQKS